MAGYDHRQRKTTFSPAPSSGPPGRNYGGGNNNNNNAQQSRQSQSDNRFGGNMEQANTRVVSPKVTNTNVFRDNKVVEESFEKDLAKQQVFKDQRTSYTPPAKEYGPPKGQGRSNINLFDLGFNGADIESLTAGLSPKTMGFFGYTPGMANMPVQLYQMLAEGSLTNTLDYFADKDLKTDGIQFGNEDFTGTYSELEKGTHKMFPGGIQQYYDEMSMPKFQPIVSGGGGGYGGGYGGGGGGGSDGGQGGYIYGTGGGLPQTYQRGQVGPGNLQEQVNQAYLSGGRGFARGGIVSLLRL